MTIKAIETKYNGYLFRSRSEARWGVFFDATGIKYEYEKEGFKMNGIFYLPDFWLPDFNVWFEVKGVEPTKEEIRKAQSLRENSGFDVWLSIGQPIGNPQIIVFSEENKYYENRFFLADDRRNHGEFWLVSDSDSFSIGPVFGPNHCKFPGIYSATLIGYEASRKARFEYGEQP